MDDGPILQQKGERERKAISQPNGKIPVSVNV
jgi:hypothetical protein